MKRILSMLLAIVMVVSMIPVAVSAAEVISGLASADADSKWTYAYTATKDGTLTITVGDGNTAWASDVYDWNTWSASAAVTGTDAASYSYDVVADAEYTIRIYGQGDPCAAIVDVPYSVVFTPASGEDDSNVTVYGTVLNNDDGIAMQGTDVTLTGGDYASAVEHYFTPAEDGILTVHIINSSTGWWYSGENLCGMKSGSGEWAQTYEVRAGTNYSITLGCYEDWAQVGGTISYEILFYAQELAVQKEEYIIAETVITAPGTVSVAMEENAEMTVVTITPAETGVYTLSVPAGTALLNDVGAGSFFIQSWDDAEAAESIEWTCKEIAGQVVDTTSEGVEVLSQGQSLMLGIKSENASVDVTMTKTGEYVKETVEEIVYQNKATLTPFVLPEGAILGEYVDVMDETTHTAVLDEEGFYRLDTIDGDYLLIDMDYQDIILSAALNSDRPVMKVNTTLADGTPIIYNIGAAVQEYEAVTDENGYYYLTEDLILFYKDYATENGTWIYNGIDSLDDPNEDAWLYCCRTMEAAKEYPLGHIYNPVIYNTIEEMVADWTNKEVAGNTETYFVAPVGLTTVGIESAPEGYGVLISAMFTLAYSGESYTFSAEEGFTEGQQVLLGVYNASEEPETVTLTVAAPADGSFNNPFVYESFEALIADWQNRTVAAGTTVYVKAPLGGETLIVSSDTTAAALVNSMGAYVAYHGEACVFDAFEAGATVTIGICNQNPRGSAVVTLSAPASGANVPGSGTVADPYRYDTVEALIADWQERVIAAGTTVFVNAPLGGETLTVTSNSTAACLATTRDANLAFHNEPYTFSEMDGFTAGQFITIGIKNQDPYGTTIATLSADSVSGGDEGETVITYTELPMGSSQINAMDYHYIFTAEEDGELSLSMGAAIDPPVALTFTLNDGEITDSLEPNQSLTAELSAGDVVKIDITTTGYSSLSALWTPAGGAGEEDPNALVIGDNEVSVPAGLEGGSWIFTATEAGTLSASVSALTLYEPSYEVEGEFVANEVPASHVTMVVGMQMSFQINGLDALNETVEVAAGDEVTVTMSHRSGTAFDATITLTLTEGSEGGEPNGSMSNPWIIESLPYEGTYEAGSDVYYRYNASGVQTLLITVPDDVICSGIGTVSVDNLDGTKTYTYTTVEDEVVEINPWGGSVTGVFTVYEGEYVPSEPDGSMTNPWIIESLPYEGTYEAGSDVYYRYNASGVQTLLITVPDDVICSGVGTDSVDNLDGTKTYTYTTVEDEVVEINPWGGSVTGVFTVCEGEYVPAEPDGSYRNPYILDELYTTVPTVVEPWSSVFYKHEATTSGVFDIDIAEDTEVYFEIYVDGILEGLPYSYQAGQTIVIGIYENGGIELDTSFEIVNAAVAQVGGVNFGIVAEALSAAADLGEPATVTLLKDANAWDLMVTPGITLDLNGFELRANYVAVFNGGHIIDSSAANTGKLCVGADSLIVCANNAQLPVWNGWAYVFCAVDFSRSKLNGQTTADGFGYVFQPQFATAVRELLMDGGDDNGVTVEVRISWNTDNFREYRNLVYTSAQLAKVVSAGNGGAFMLTVTGFSAIEGISEITVEAVARSATGVACLSEGIVVTLPNG